MYKIFLLMASFIVASCALSATEEDIDNLLSEKNWL